MVLKKIFANSKRKLTADETQEIITPFAFKLNEDLFGTPIASPYKRALALLIDLLLIAILSNAGGEFLAIAIAIMAFRIGSKRRAKQQGQEKGYKRRAVLRFFGAFILLLVLLDTLAPNVNRLFSDSPGRQAEEHRDWQQSKIASTIKDGVALDGDDMGVGQALGLAGIVVNAAREAKQRQCQEYDCWYEILSSVPVQVKQLGLNEQQVITLITKATAELDMNSADAKKLQRQLLADYNALNSDNSQYAGDQREEGGSNASLSGDSQPTDNSASDVNESALSQTSTSSQLSTAIPQEISSAIDNTKLGELRKNKQQHDANEKSRPIYSIMQYIKALVDDLGLGFGWAALYFTVFTSWWQGRTPGKRLLGIRVLQLDGTPLSVWDSFGRYGGYGAGIATGLLGFLQVFWDANRQAIHDKISATVVIDERKKVDEAIVAAARAKIAEHNDNTPTSNS